jgi:hypothetical protein
MALGVTTRSPFLGRVATLLVRAALSILFLQRIPTGDGIRRRRRILLLLFLLRSFVSLVVVGIEKGKTTIHGEGEGGPTRRWSSRKSDESSSANADANANVAQSEIGVW